MGFIAPTNYEKGYETYENTNFIWALTKTITPNELRKRKTNNTNTRIISQQQGRDPRLAIRIIRVLFVIRWGGKGAQRQMKKQKHH